MFQRIVWASPAIGWDHRRVDAGLVLSVDPKYDKVEFENERVQVRLS